MTKEEFTSELKDLRDKRQKLHESERLLKEQYIALNKKFEAGQRVKVVFAQGSEIGVVNGFKINYSNNIEYVINKLKKNGEPSQREIWMYNVVSIEPA